MLQPEEVYNGVPIVYSLGNFCYGGNRSPENRTIIYKALLSVEDGVLTGQTTQIIPCYVYTGSTNNLPSRKNPTNSSAACTASSRIITAVRPKISRSRLHQQLAARPDHR